MAPEKDQPATWPSRRPNHAPDGRVQREAPGPGVAWPASGRWPTRGRPTGGRRHRTPCSCGVGGGTGKAPVMGPNRGCPGWVPNAPRCPASGATGTSGGTATRAVHSRKKPVIRSARPARAAASLSPHSPFGGRFPLRPGCRRGGKPVV